MDKMTCVFRKTLRHWTELESLVISTTNVLHQHRIKRLMEACALLSASTSMRRQFQGHQLEANLPRLCKESDRETETERKRERELSAMKMSL